jgi:signal peptidase I
MPVETNWEFWIVSATLLCGFIILVYWLLDKISDKKKQADPVLLDYAKSFFPVLLFVVVLRSFVAEPFRIPSGSMIPTLEIGDFILVKKYAYGVRLPVIHTKILDTGEPQRGDVVVFRYPPQPEINYIKRLIGLPGDTIKYTQDKKLFINGKLVVSKPLTQGNESLQKDQNDKHLLFVEQLPLDKSGETMDHEIQQYPEMTQRYGEWKVPPGHYFMMGDNRDNSKDSRYWKFVPEANLVGKASLVWMHWNWQNGGDGFQSHRIGTEVN